MRNSFADSLSTGQLFTAWTEKEESIAEQCAAIDYNMLSSPRCTFCVHVDAEALDECLRCDALPEKTQWKFMHPNRDPAFRQAAYVSIVEEVMSVYGDPQYDDEEDSEEEEDALSFKAHWPVGLPGIYNEYKAFQ